MKVPDCKCGNAPEFKYDAPTFGAKNKTKIKLACSCGRETGWHSGNRDLTRVKRSAVKDWKGLVSAGAA